jgi:hypothetical protein
MKRFFSAFGMLGVVFFLMAGKASADIVYTFSGVTFGDGGTLTGQFTTNDAISALLDFDITTSAGSDIGFQYTTATAQSASTSLPFILVLGTPTLDNILQVTFSNLTAAGSPITIDTFGSFEQTLNARRDITAGSVVGVPEHSTIALVAMGVLGLAGYASRRRRA